MLIRFAPLDAKPVTAELAPAAVYRDAHPGATLQHRPTFEGTEDWYRFRLKRYC